MAEHPAINRGFVPVLSCFLAVLWLHRRLSLFGQGFGDFEDHQKLATFTPICH